MNQAIIFVDRVEFNEQQRRVYFFAQVSGLMVSCFYTTNLAKEDAIKAFDANKFEYEDIAEKAIEDELYNGDGEVEVEELL